MGRERRTACQEAGEKCEFNVAHTMVYDSPDGKVFRVRRMVCHKCNERLVAAQREASFVPPSWRKDRAAVEANF